MIQCPELGTTPAFSSNAQQVQSNFPIMWPRAVLEEIDTLPGAQGKLTINDGY